MAAIQLNRPISLFVALAFGVGSWQTALAQQPRPANGDPFAPAERRNRERAEAPREVEANAATSVRSDPSSAAKRLEQELDTTTDVNVVEMPLKDCMLFLSERHQIPIVLNIKKLEEASISPDSPITKSLRGITLRSALNLILADLEGAFLVKDEVLQITTQADARTFYEVRVYDCRDLLGRHGSSGDSEVPPQPGGGGERGGFGGSGRARMSDHEQRVQRLLALLIANVDPDSWQDSPRADDGLDEPGFRGGAVSEYDGLIVVTQTAPTQEKVERLLNMLREAAGMENRTGRVVR